jgi:hypothetical protein
MTGTTIRPIDERLMLFLASPQPPMTGTAVRPIDKHLTFGLAVVAYDRNHGYAVDVLHQDE